MSRLASGERSREATPTFSAPNPLFIKTGLGVMGPGERSFPNTD